jgi:hypothetical protein
MYQPYYSLSFPFLTRILELPNTKSLVRFLLMQLLTRILELPKAGALVRCRMRSGILGAFVLPTIRTWSASTTVVQYLKFNYDFI